MVRITVNHTNKYGPLVFPARGTQIFVEDAKVPPTNLMAFYDSCVKKWLKENPDRQLFSWQKDIVQKDAMPDGSKIYGPTDEALGVTAVKEEEL
jgi:hypothetical protein